MAIGDERNDLDMFAFTGTSVAMGNGDPRIFDRVSFVTAPVEQDGIAKARAAIASGAAKAKLEALVVRTHALAA